MNLHLTTSRLTLRPFRLSDLPTFLAYRNDPKVARYQGWDIPYTPEQAKAFFTDMQQTQPGKPGEWYQLVIEHSASQVMLGDCAFYVLKDESRQAEIGFTLAAAYQGQGYASEAVRRLLAYLFTELNLHRVRANCDPLNMASAHLLKSVGFRHEGHFVESLWFKGAWADEAWYGLLGREWQIHQQNDQTTKLQRNL